MYRPKALATARDYIEAIWRDEGYEVGVQEYEAEAVRCANLEVSRTGASRAGEIILLGAHYDSVRDCPRRERQWQRGRSAAGDRTSLRHANAGAHGPLRGLR